MPAHSLRRLGIDAARHRLHQVHVVPAARERARQSAKANRAARLMLDRGEKKDAHVSARSRATRAGASLRDRSPPRSWNRAPESSRACRPNPAPEESSGRRLAGVGGEVVGLGFAGREIDDELAAEHRLKQEEPTTGNSTNAAFDSRPSGAKVSARTPPGCCAPNGIESRSARSRSPLPDGQVESAQPPPHSNCTRSSEWRLVPCSLRLLRAVSRHARLGGLTSARIQGTRRSSS